MFNTTREAFKAEVDIFRKEFTLGEMAKAIAVASKKPEVEGVVAALIGGRTEKPMDFSRAADLMANSRFNVGWNSLSAALKEQGPYNERMAIADKILSMNTVERQDLFKQLNPGVQEMSCCAVGEGVQSDAEASIKLLAKALKMNPEARPDILTRVTKDAVYYDLEACNSLDGPLVAPGSVNYNAWTAKQFFEFFASEAQWPDDSFRVNTTSSIETMANDDGNVVLVQSIGFENLVRRDQGDAIGSFSLMIDCVKGQLVEYTGSMNGEGVAVHCPSFINFKGNSFLGLKTLKAQSHAARFHDSWKAEDVFDLLFDEAEWDDDSDLYVCATGSKEVDLDSDVNLIKKAIFLKSRDNPCNEPVLGLFVVTFDVRCGKVLDYYAGVVDGDNLAVHCPSFDDLKKRSFTGLLNNSDKGETSAHDAAEISTSKQPALPDCTSWSAEEFCDYFFAEAGWGDDDVVVKETGGVDSYDDSDGVTIVSQTVYFESHERPDDDSVAGVFSLMIDNRQGKLVEYTASMGDQGLAVHCPSFLKMKGRPYSGLCDMTYAEQKFFEHIANQAKDKRVAQIGNGCTVISNEVFDGATERAVEQLKKRFESGALSSELDFMVGFIEAMTLISGGTRQVMVDATINAMSGRSYLDGMTPIYVVRECDDDDQLFELLKVYRNTTMEEAGDKLEEDYPDDDLVEMLTEVQMQQRFAWNIKANKPIVQEQTVRGSRGSKKILIDN